MPDTLTDTETSDSCAAEKLFNKREWLSVPEHGSMVRDFDTIGAWNTSAGPKTMVINHVKRSPMELLVSNNVKKPALDPEFYVKLRVTAGL